MKYCRSKDGRDAFIVATTVMVMCLLVIVTKSWSLLQMHPENNSAWIYGFVYFSIVVFFIIALIVALMLVWKFRKFELTVEGIVVAYFSRFPRKIPWKMISEIAICRVHFTTRGGWDTVIRIVVGPEFEGPSQGNGSWSFERYSITHQDRIIIIDYTPETLKEFMEICPIPVHDYR